MAVEALISRIQSAFGSMAMTAAQEDFIADTLQSGLDQLLEIQNEMAGLQEQLSNIVAELAIVRIQPPS